MFKQTWLHFYFSDIYELTVQNSNLQSDMQRKKKKKATKSQINSKGFQVRLDVLHPLMK